MAESNEGVMYNRPKADPRKMVFFNQFQKREVEGIREWSRYYFSPLLRASRCKWKEVARQNGPATDGATSSPRYGSGKSPAEKIEGVQKWQL
jgi:hypothetical protein